jgi:hypothetical protein
MTFLVTQGTRIVRESTSSRLTANQTPNPLNDDRT